MNTIPTAENDVHIIPIIRDAARRLLWCAPEIGRNWEVDAYVAAFITDELRGIWHRCAQTRDWQEIYTACENLVCEIWARVEPLEKVPQSYLVNADTATTLAGPQRNGEVQFGSDEKTNKRLENTWSEHAIQKLQQEYQEPGVTHQILADRYGVSRQFIGAILKRAKPKKANAFSLYAAAPRKK